LKLSSFGTRWRAGNAVFQHGEMSGNKGRQIGLSAKQARTAAMQFILDLIWNKSRNRFLATIGEPEMEQ
jgi:hypothetical protein